MFTVSCVLLWSCARPIYQCIAHRIDYRHSLAALCFSLLSLLSQSTYEQEVPSPGPSASGSDVLFVRAQGHCDNKTPHIVLNEIWYCWSRPMPVCILFLKSKYVALIERHIACYSHCYVTWCSITTGIVASQYLSSRDAQLVKRYPRPHNVRRLNTSITFPLQSPFFTIYLHTSLKVMMINLTWLPW